MPRLWEISADEIASWASSTSAPSILPKLVRRLLFATTVVRSLAMRADAGVLLPGWDGIVETDEGSAFCPIGTSYWELSTDNRVEKKLDSDFAKRASSDEGTYVAVTARRFARKAQWAQAKEASGPFRSVVVLDADDLAAWMEQAPTVARWFATLLGRATDGAQDVETFISGWERRTTPRLSASLALASRARDEVAAQLRSWLTLPPSRPFVIRGDTREDALVFAASALAASGDLSERLLASAVVVDAIDTWRQLRAHARSQTHPPILLANVESLDPGEAEETARNGVLVILPIDASAPFDAEGFHLPAIPHGNIADFLRRTGLSENDATRIARESGGRLTALQRLFRYTVPPEWASSAATADILSLLLVGAWDPSVEGDRLAVERLGANPSSLEALCVELSNTPDAPIIREFSRGRRGQWRWVSPSDAWRALARRLTDSQLKAFSEVAVSTLSEPDPRYSMDRGQRIYASVRGQVVTCSAQMRSGIAHSLVRLALADNDLKPTLGPARGSLLADAVVERILMPDWRAWASVSPLLPTIAEASPGTFLDCVDRSLDQGPTGIQRLLHEEEPTFGPSPHTGLLWALEALGWSAVLFPRVASALARLAVYDPPGAKLANRPLTSLSNLLHPLLPQSVSTVEDRLRVLENLTTSNQPTLSAIGWSVGHGHILATQARGVLFPSHKPSDRPWPLPDDKQASQREAS